MNKVIVAGVSMIKFSKPGQQQPFRIMAAQAIQGALADAGLEPKAIQQAYGSYIYGDSTCGQHALYDAFMTGIPFINVNNNCSSGSTAIFLARQAVASGAVDCVLAFGFEEMQKGALGSHWQDRESPFDIFHTKLDQMGYPEGPIALRAFGAAGHDYLCTYDADPSLYAKVAVKTRTHALNNSFALLNTPLTEADVLDSPIVYMNYLTRFMCCPPTCGAAATVICSEAFAKKHGIDASVAITGQAMTTDTPSSWDNARNLVGADMTQRAADQVYQQTGVNPLDIDVVELHDCFVPNEVISYEGLRLCPAGGATEFVENKDNTYGGQTVVNPSGGLMSKGHPVGATGLAQCFELTQQLRGNAGARQVQDAKIGLQHNLGLGGAAVVTLYQKQKRS
ncbi:lipid-transfer protein [Reinekea marina]|uniref:propanoyl-CoA C-acyltransferase n=1 Tax=Reinekea marina TaxID=1310421 RepID=A0ABV7WSZ3_9GAMM|nr:lipid-transfer protein [Reinekea marina]MDN3648887.1 lipid-transfer protein [Reinekea marina]